MKIAILSRNPRLYSTRRLVEAATQRGHEARVIDVLQHIALLVADEPGHRRPALLHEHRLAPAQHPPEGRGTGPL